MAALLLPALLILGPLEPQQRTASLAPPRRALAAKPAAPLKAESTAAQVKQTKVYTLRFGAARKVAHGIGQVLKTRFSIETQRDGVVVESPVLVMPDVATNRLIVCAEKKFITAIDKLVEQLDRAPQQVVVRAKLTRTNADGEKTVIAKPQIMTLNGQTSTFKINDKHGGVLEIEITPFVLPRREMP